MKPFVDHVGVAAALRAENVDTDVIIPMQALLSVPREGLGQHAFGPLRFRDDGGERPEFVLNQEPFRKASILIAGRNFGCGSSREGAVNAIEAIGLRVIIAPSFGDIFYGNCLKNGLLAIRLEDAEVHGLMREAEAAAGQSPFHIDLRSQTVIGSAGSSVEFQLDQGHKARLLEGRDEVAITLDREREIKEFRAGDRRRRPWAWHLATGGDR